VKYGEKGCILFAFVLLLLLLEDVLIELLLQLFVGVVYTQLLEAVDLSYYV
jgi:hypothetical protein